MLNVKIFANFVHFKLQDGIYLLGLIYSVSINLFGKHLLHDYSPLLYASQHVFRHPTARTGESPELKLIYYKLCRLASVPAMFKFVIDGDMRPSIKRQTLTSGGDHWMVDPVVRMIEAFGFEVLRVRHILSTVKPC